MSKVKCSDSVRLCGFVEEFGEKYFTTDWKILFCKNVKWKSQLRNVLQCNNC